MKQLTIIEKYAIVIILSQIMNADGVIHPKEEEYMNKIYEEFDISIDDLEDMEDMDATQANSVFSVMSDDKKKYARSLFISMSEADGYVHPFESALIERYFLEKR